MKNVRQFPQVFTEAEVAKFLGLTISTLYKKRCLGVEHPPFKKIGGKTVYPVDEFYEWWESLPLRRELTHR